CSVQNHPNRTGSSSKVWSVTGAGFRLSRSPASAAVLDGFAGDDHLLDLAGALVGPEDGHVAIEAFDAVVGDIAGAAEGLHCAVGDPADHFRGEILRGRGVQGDVLTGVVLAGDIQR